MGQNKKVLILKKTEEGRKAEIVSTNGTKKRRELILGLFATLDFKSQKTGEKRHTKGSSQRRFPLKSSTSPPTLYVEAECIIRAKGKSFISSKGEKTKISPQNIRDESFLRLFSAVFDSFLFAILQP